MTHATYHPRPLAALSGHQLLLLDEIHYLSERWRERSRSGTAYATPSREYLAAKLRCSVVTVSRHIARLVKLGYLDRTQRRPRLGQYQTNLYRLNHALAQPARRLVASLQAALSRVSHVIHKQRSNSNGNQKRSAVGAVLGPRTTAVARPEALSAAETTARRAVALDTLAAMAKHLRNR